MQFVGFMLVIVVALLIKENFCVPAIRPLSQRGIIFPKDNWDDCFLDEASSKPGLCKTLEQCPEIAKKWDQEKVYPKTCYFIKKEQFVCCPSVIIKEVPTITEQIENIFNQDSTVASVSLEELIKKVFTTKSATLTTSSDLKDASRITKTPSNIFLDKVKNKKTTTTARTTTSTNRPSNIFLDEVKNRTTTTTITPTLTTTSTNRPSNIFLDEVTNRTTITTAPTSTLTTTSTMRPSNIFLDIVRNTTTTFTTTTTATTSSKRPSNIFLENLNTQSITNKTPFDDIFTTDQGSFIKRRSETECEIQNQENLDTIETSDFPFMAVLGWKSEIDDKVWYPCGGVLISPRFVLTAAHCADIAGLTPSIVHLGDQNLTDSAKDTIKIQQFIKHPNYNETIISNDIALVELEEEVYYATPCLWIQPDLPIGKFSALGYGQINFENASSSNQLFKADLTSIDNAECQEIYNNDEKLKHLKVIDTHLCAGDQQNIHNLCQGDTGGPLIVEVENVVYVLGITAFGLGCADLPPSIFTRVSSFIDWIEPIVWPEIDVRIDGI